MKTEVFIKQIHQLVLFSAMYCFLLFGNFHESQAASNDIPNIPGKSLPATTTRINRHSQITLMNGVPTLQVDGLPFLIVGAQCDIWRSTRQDEKAIAFFDGYQAMNATVVSVGIPWSKIEQTKDHYDFKFLDWFIQQARNHGLKLIINLFNSNVCGKVQEGASPSPYPQYTPDYILSAPNDYQRMKLPDEWTYDAGGPPMCPNDPRTLERERLLCAQIATHLAEFDAAGTVVMMQIDNEFYYQQWAGKRPADEKSIRCHCRFCEEKWPQSTWKDGEDFMFHAFAEYVRVLTQTISDLHPLPLYLNSPWWPPHVIPIFLDRCPQLAAIGVDGIFDPREPNMLSRSQVGRNIPFAAENPTEEPKTRLNLDVLPYYTLIGQMGLGNLLWECSPPRTVVDDPVARQRYGAALYPIRWAQWPIAKARGTEDLVGWYALRELAPDLATDHSGNYLSTNAHGTVVSKQTYFVREGMRTRMENAEPFNVNWNHLRIEVRESAAGILAKISATEFILAMPRGRLSIAGPHSMDCIEGKYEADRWVSGRTFSTPFQGDAFVVESEEPKVILLKIKP